MARPRSVVDEDEAVAAAAAAVAEAAAVEDDGAVAVAAAEEVDEEAALFKARREATMWLTRVGCLSALCVMRIVEAMWRAVA